MTKTKIVLSALALVGAIGGAFALKAKKVGQLSIQYSFTPHNGFCTVQGEALTLNTSPVNTPLTIYVYDDNICDAPYRYGLTN